MKMKVFAILLGVFISQSSLASGGGNVVGNGGDGMVCGEDVMFFDLYEGEATLGLKSTLGDKNLDPYQKVQNALERLRPSNLNLGISLSMNLEEFQERAKFGDFDLVDIGDTENVVIKPGCKLVQAVIQIEPLSSEQPVYYVDQRLWNKMDNDSRAALVMHEIIYRFAIKLGHTDSRRVRILNAYLLSVTLDDLKKRGDCFYNVLTKELELIEPNDSSRFNGVRFNLKKSDISPTCAIKNGYIQDEAGAKINALRMDFTVRNDNSADGKSFIPGVMQYTDGTLFKILTASEDTVQVGEHVIHLAGTRDQAWQTTNQWKTEDRDSITVRQGVLTFHPSGNLMSASVKNTSVMFNGQEIVFDGDIYFGDRKNIHRIEKTSGEVLVPK